MARARIVLCGLAMWAAGCAHQRLSGRDLDRVDRPALLGRIEEAAGPKSSVFRKDDSYKGQLKRLDAKEGDRRLQLKLSRGMSRWEVSERLRATTLSMLPKEHPWTAAVDPVAVARVLQSYLVEEVPVNEPDYALLRQLGADVVLEFVIEEYGMRSRDGRALAYVRGHARMFRLEGGVLWRRGFELDSVQLDSPHLDPFRVAKEPDLYRQEMNRLIDAVAQGLAQDLNPPDRSRDARPREGGNDGVPPPPASDAPGGDELPDPL
ncbi:MAG TPA: hypothetical protein VEY30_04335 [Myxococcaceae bacterium]|nr:hypothetical protein [Myxococcaceae bacterium]